MFQGDKIRENITQLRDKKPTNWLGQEKATKIRPKAVGGGIFNSFLRDNLQPEIVSDVISGVIVDQTGTDVREKFGDSKTVRDRPYVSMMG